MRKIKCMVLFWAVIVDSLKCEVDCAEDMGGVERSYPGYVHATGLPAFSNLSILNDKLIFHIMWLLHPQLTCLKAVLRHCFLWLFHLIFPLSVKCLFCVIDILTLNHSVVIINGMTKFAWNTQMDAGNSSWYMEWKSSKLPLCYRSSAYFNNVVSAPPVKSTNLN